ncbi:MAG: ATP-binding protein, partial [Rubrobacteraceae bacterium]
QRGQVYLILREAVRNAVRHSGCSRITVGLDVTPQEFSGFVRDDGRGLTGKENGDSPDGFGLQSMSERAGLMKGETRVYSLSEGGTGMEVRVPL